MYCTVACCLDETVTLITWTHPALSPSLFTSVINVNIDSITTNTALGTYQHTMYIYPYMQTYTHCIQIHGGTIWWTHYTKLLLAR
jgi:alanine dehydrogenase